MKRLLAVFRMMYFIRRLVSGGKYFSNRKKGRIGIISGRGWERNVGRFGNYRVDICFLQICLYINILYITVRVVFI
jgi:hypothetical protein